MKAEIVLIRHGQSQWNLENRFTGWVDVALTPKGEEEAKKAGEKLKTRGFKPDIVYTSALQRAQKTLSIILDTLGVNEKKIPSFKDQALNERHYGDLQGKNKAETAAQFGADQVQIWRRSYDVAPPNGESLKGTAARTLPYFVAHILPALREGKKILVSAHGNSLRSIVMEIEKMTPEQILKTEFETGGYRAYTYDTETRTYSKPEIG